MKARKLDAFVDARVLEGLLGAAIVLIVISAVMVVGPVVTGSIYEATESDINAISDATVKASVKASAQSGFEGMETLGDYLPLIVLAIVAGGVIGIIVYAFAGNRYAGGAL